MTDQPDTVEQTPDPDPAAVDVPVDSELTPDAEPDSFDRTYVERLRKEAAGYRDRAHSAEARVGALQKAAAEQLIAGHGLKADAVWAVTTIDELLDDDGAVDPTKIKDAVAAAKDKLGIRPAPQGLSGMRSGNMAAQPPRNSWREAFTAPHKR